MIGIMRKDAGTFILLFLLVVPGSWLYFLGTRDALDFGVVFAAGAFLYLVVMVPVLHNEISESGQHGYAFLATLPIARARIARGKFALPFITAAAYALQAFAFLARFEAGGDALLFARAYLAANFALCLCLVGFYYVGIFRFGFTAFFRFTAIVIVVVPYVAAMLFDETIGSILRGDIDRFDWFFRSPLPGIAAAAGIAAYVALMGWAAKVKEVAR